MAEEQKEPRAEGFMEIGSSPTPGVRLRQFLREPGHIDAWSPDGKYLAIRRDESSEFGIDVWEVTKGNHTMLNVEKSPEYRRTEDEDSFYHTVPGLSWSPDGQYLAACYSFFHQSYPSSWDTSTLYVWNTKNWNVSLKTMLGVDEGVKEIAWSPKQSTIAACRKKKGLLFLNAENGKFIDEPLEGKIATRAVWSPDGDRLALYLDSRLQIYNRKKNRLERGLGNDEFFVWHPNGQLLASGGDEKVIHIWDTNKGVLKRTIEGHTEKISSLAFSSNGRFLISTSKNETLLWQTDSWENIIGNYSAIGKLVTFNPNLPLLLTRVPGGLGIWDVDYEALSSRETPQKSVQYTTAKLVIVGDSGVGKTGLGWRLAHNEFKEHSSTHGQQFWIAPALGNRREDGTECEAVLWDLAGQHVYRSIHSIFLDNVDTSIILFDPTNRQDPLKGAQFWLEQLKGNKQLPPSVLVGARVDRGAPVLSQEELDQFCQKYGVSGGYIGTSAKSGEGMDQLVETLKRQIPWEKMPATVTNTTFKKIKEFVLALKENPDRRNVLVKPDDLKEMLEATDKAWSFSEAEMMTAVGHLANHGYVNILRNSAGEKYILLTADLLVYLASSIVLLADKHPKELGAVSETDLLQGKYQFDELKGLEQKEQQILIDAAILRFLEHNVCFRETTENDTLLVFPTLIKQKRPLDEASQSIDGTSYIIRGSVENLYARMVVLLGYTPSFTRVNQWQNQSQYVTTEGSLCGFRLIEDHEGEIELILYYGNNTSAQERDSFQVLFERFLYQHKVEITPFPAVSCPNGHPQERATVVKRSREGKKALFCDECGAKTDLPVPTEQKVFDFEIPEWLRREEAMARLKGVYEAQIANVKSYRRDWETPRAYLSFASEQNEFANTLKIGLSEAGIIILDDPARVDESSSIIMISSPDYEGALAKGILVDDRKLISSRAKNNYKGLLTIKQVGGKGMHEIAHCEPDSFSDETHHLVNLFDLVLHLYSIPLEHAGFKQLRQALHQQWEQTLAREARTDKSAPSKEIFISYAWGGESEKIVNELDGAFQKRGITIVRDKRDLGFKGRIKGFMETIGKGKVVVLVISEKYLKSENCLFELLQIAKHGGFEERIFPIVLEDSRIYKPLDRIRYVEYWEQQFKELDDAMKRVSAANMHGFREDIDLYAEIRANLPRLADILKDMNTLTPSIHRDADFQTLFDAVMAKLEE